ncbi:MAG TPA: hypothetical protein VIY73_06240, partial [Polyangiaceae bacterium]
MDAELRVQARRVLGVEAARPAYVDRRRALEMGAELKSLLRGERDGKLAAFKSGRRVVYRVDDVVSFIESCPVLRAERSAKPAVPPDDGPAPDAWDAALARAARRRRSTLSKNGGSDGGGRDPGPGGP